MAVWHFVAWAGSNRSQPGRWMLYPRPTTVLVAGSIACRLSERDSHATHQALGVDKRCRTTWQRYVERRAKQPADSLCAALRRSLDLRVSFPSPYDPLPDAGYWLSLWARLESETKKRYRNQIFIGIIAVL